MVAFLPKPAGRIPYRNVVVAGGRREEAATGEGGGAKLHPIGLPREGDEAIPDAVRVIGVAHHRPHRESPFRSWRMIGRVGRGRATVLKPARANAAAVPVKTLDELAGRAVSTG
jgi:hypothetical protein